jgi:hypothetical protein
MLPLSLLGSITAGHLTIWFFKTVFQVQVPCFPRDDFLIFNFSIYNASSEQYRAGTSGIVKLANGFDKI